MDRNYKLYIATGIIVVGIGASLLMSKHDSQNENLKQVESIKSFPDNSVVQIQEDATPSDRLKELSSKILPKINKDNLDESAVKDVLSELNIKEENYSAEEYEMINYAASYILSSGATGVLDNGIETVTIGPKMQLITDGTNAEIDYTFATTNNNLAYGIMINDLGTTYNYVNYGNNQMTSISINNDSETTCVIMSITNGDKKSNFFCDNIDKENLNELIKMLSSCYTNKKDFPSIFYPKKDLFIKIFGDDFKTYLENNNNQNDSDESPKLTRVSEKKRIKR